jgi:hypothetical protein
VCRCRASAASAPRVHSVIPTSYSVFPASYSVFPASYPVFPASYSVFPASYSVIPAQAGIQCPLLDSRLRGNDGWEAGMTGGKRE